MLENEAPEAAVAIGAAFYGKLAPGSGGARRLLIRAGSARSYYIGVDAELGTPAALCVMPRGTEEGTRFDLDRALTVVSNQPAAFTLYSSHERADPVNALVVLDRRRASCSGMRRSSPPSATASVRGGYRSRSG